MKVIWTQKALTRLEEIEEYISTDSPSCAIGFVSELMDQAELSQTSLRQVGPCLRMKSGADVNSFTKVIESFTELRGLLFIF